MNSRIKRYVQSVYDGTWWVEFTDDRPARFYGITPPERTKYPVIYRPSSKHSLSIHG